MSKSSCLRATDVRALFLLIGECCERGDEAVAWRLHFNQGVAGLVDAELAQGLEGELVANAPTVGGAYDWGWENGLNQEPLLQALAAAKVRGDLSDAMPMLAYLERFGLQDGRGISCRAFFSDKEWYGSDYFKRIHGPQGIDSMIESFQIVPGQPTRVSGLCVSRKFGKRDFSERDCRIVGEAHALLAPLLGGRLALSSEPSPRNLPARARRVLACLLEGDSDKQIAARLGISVYTVNQYTKRIHRHFTVKSRAELLARWIKRGWGACFSWVDGSLQMPTSPGPTGREEARHTASGYSTS